jgi:hypothetical protein
MFLAQLDLIQSKIVRNKNPITVTTDNLILLHKDYGHVGCTYDLPCKWSLTGLGWVHYMLSLLCCATRAPHGFVVVPCPCFFVVCPCTIVHPVQLWAVAHDGGGQVLGHLLLEAEGGSGGISHHH